MKKRIDLLLAALVIVWLSVTLVKVENQRYALQVGMCREANTRLTDFKCLETVQTRTGWWWHLFYALRD